MISDASIFRAASLLTDRYGADIVIEAAGLLDLLLDPNDDRRKIGDALARAIVALQGLSSAALR